MSRTYGDVLNHEAVQLFKIYLSDVTRSNMRSAVKIIFYITGSTKPPSVTDFIFKQKLTCNVLNIRVCKALERIPNGIVSFDNLSRYQFIILYVLGLSSLAYKSVFSYGYLMTPNLLKFLQK